MTIDSNWIASLKGDCPQAFTSAAPFWPTAVFIDGQIKLNSASFEHTQTWDEYIKRQFLFRIQKYLNTAHVKAVILAFDNYEFVPRAKHMTQARRRQNIPLADFNSRDALPPTVPKGELWISHLCNRSFKSRLIEMVVYFLVQHLVIRPDQQLIIDYTSHPVSYNHCKESSVFSDLQPLGEADVKFMRYVSMFNKLQVDSIDGDSVPIALLYMQKHYSENPNIRISILRMVCTVESTPKRKRAGREYEYLDINLLYLFIVQDLIPQCVDRVVLPRIVGFEISMLVILIALSGTDFSRKLSCITGKSLYEYMPLLWIHLAMAFDVHCKQVHAETVLHKVLTVIYKHKFDRHVSEQDCTSLDNLLHALHNSKLSTRTKNQLQTIDVMRCTVQNANWILQYWDQGTYPDPLSSNYGFTVDREGVMAFQA